MSENNAETAETAVNPEESFADLLEKSLGSQGRLKPGQRIKATVVSVNDESVYIDLGGKTEGIIDANEFRAEDGSLTISAGAEVEAFFIAVSGGIRKFTTLVRGYSAQSISAIKAAFEAGLPVSGDVKKELKGGFEITVGGVRCFCPYSQIDLRPSDASNYVGKGFQFKVLEFKEDGRNVVVSRRALLEEERKARIESLKETLNVGDEITGIVRAIQDFGAFIDLGGVDGMIPLSEISWERDKKPADLLAVGQEIKVKVIALDWERSRLALSLKALQPDPWAGVAERYPEGSKISGVVVKLEPFGAFVNLEPGIDGLVHISNLGTGRRIVHPKEVVEVGQLIEAYVIGVDPKARKISLSLKPKVKVEKIALPEVGEVFDAAVEKVMTFGLFVKLPSGLSALVPNSEMGTQRGADHTKMFPQGASMQVMVKEVDKKKGKVMASRKALIEKTEKEEFSKYIDSSKKAEQKGWDTLAEKLKEEMEKKSR